ncbi:MAG: pentapeptide repeat-containing protein, partial [Aphanizomenon sp.]
MSETVIKNVDFSRASLYNVNLTNANLKESVFATELTSVLAVAFSPDGKVLATGEKDGRVRLWNVITGKELLTLRGHSSGVRSVAWSGDNLT